MGESGDVPPVQKGQKEGHKGPMTKVLIYGAGAIGSFFGYLLSGGNRKMGGGTEGGARPVVEEVALPGEARPRREDQGPGPGGLFAPGDKPLSIRFSHAFTGLGEFAESEFAPRSSSSTVDSRPAGGREGAEGVEASGGEALDARFILLMNGMGNPERFDLPGARVYEGTTSMGVVFSGDGRIELKGRGKTVFEAGIGEDLELFIGSRLAEKGFSAEFALEFRRQQWMKLFANAVINPITALTRGRTGLSSRPISHRSSRGSSGECRRR